MRFLIKFHWNWKLVILVTLKNVAEYNSNNKLKCSLGNNGNFIRKSKCMSLDWKDNPTKSCQKLIIPSSSSHISTYIVGLSIIVEA